MTADIIHAAASAAPAASFYGQTGSNRDGKPAYGRKGKARLTVSREASLCCRHVRTGLRSVAGDNARVSIPRDYHGIPMRRPTLMPMDCWWPPAKL